MSTILVGLDGSEHAHAALEWAVAEARLRGAKVRAVYAYVPYHAADLYGVIAESQVQAIIDESDRQATEVLADAVAGLGTHADGVDVVTEVARGESPAQALVTRSEDADLLVVGSRGRGGFVGTLLGSVSQHAAQHARCPVTIVRAT